MSSFDESSTSLPKFDRDEDVAVPTGSATIISIMDRLPPAARERRANQSVDLVDRVAERIDVMAGRTRELERYVEKFEEWSSAQVEAVEMVADHWKSVTAAAEMKIDDLQRSLEFSKRRAELAECDLQNVRYRLELLHDRIAKVFGAAAQIKATRHFTSFD